MVDRSPRPREVAGRQIQAHIPTGDSAREMRLTAAMFYALAAMVFIQLVTGGLRIFGYIGESTHILAGFITFGLAVATLVVSVVSKPRYRAAVSISAVITVLVFVQGLLGFAYLDSSSGNMAIIFVHYLNALVIYGASMSGVFSAMRTSHAAPAPAVQSG